MAQYSELDARNRASRKKEDVRNDWRSPQKDGSIINRPCERSRKNRELDLADAWRDSLPGYVNVRLAILPRRATSIRYSFRVSTFGRRQKKRAIVRPLLRRRGDRRKHESGDRVGGKRGHEEILRWKELDSPSFRFSSLSFFYRFRSPLYIPSSILPILPQVFTHFQGLSSNNDNRRVLHNFTRSWW